MTDVVDAVADVVEEVAEGVIDIAETARTLGRVKIQFGTMGLVLGLGVGAAGGYFIASRRLETKFNQLAEDEIAAMREHYQDKIRAHENESSKGDLTEIVREHGYVPVEEESTGPPMGVSPPQAVVQAAADAAEKEAATPPPRVDTVKTAEIQQTEQNVFRDRAVRDHTDVFPWDYEREKRRRSPDIPYVIHIDERKEFDYDEVVWTYYAGDDVLCREDDAVVSGADRDNLVGELNLERFGHGSNDPNIVYIRNDPHEMEIEVVRSPHTYAEEVHGFTQDEEDPRGRRRERTARDDE